MPYEEDQQCTDYECIMIYQTEKAWGVNLWGDTRLIWLPMKVCGIQPVRGFFNKYVVSIPDWLAKEKKLHVD